MSFYETTGLQRPSGWQPDEKLYHILGLEGKQATLEEIKVAYKKKAREWHPDRHMSKNLSLEDRQTATEQFNIIKQAYAVLTNTAKRRVYDLYGSEGLKNFQALMTVTEPKNLDDPTPIELLVGGEMFKQKMEEKTKILHQRLQKNNLQLKVYALDACQNMIQKSDKLVSQNLSNTSDHHQSDSDSVTDRKRQEINKIILSNIELHRLKIYGLKMEHQIEFPEILKIKNLSARGHSSMGLELDNIDPKIGLDLVYRRRNHLFELQNYFEIDTVSYFDKNNENIPVIPTLFCLMYQYNNPNFIIRNFLPLNITSVDLIHKKSRQKIGKELQIQHTTNYLTVTFPFLKQESLNYLSNLVLRLGLNIKNPLRSISL